VLKIGAKRRRTKGEISAEKEEAQLKQETIAAKLEQYEVMKAKAEALEV